MGISKSSSRWGPMAMEKQPENFASETRCPKTCGASSEVTGGETPAAWIMMRWAPGGLNIFKTGYAPTLPVELNMTFVIPLDLGVTSHFQTLLAAVTVTC